MRSDPTEALSRFSDSFLGLFGPDDAYLIRNVEQLMIAIDVYTDRIDARLYGTEDGDLDLHLSGPGGGANIRAERDGHEGWKFHVLLLAPDRRSFVNGDPAEVAGVVAFALDPDGAHLPVLDAPTDPEF